MPTLRIKAPAEKDIRSLSPPIREWITHAILSLRETPFSPEAQKLQGSGITESSTNPMRQCRPSPSTA